MTTQGSGNTKPSLKGRNFQLTLNQVDKYDALKNEFEKLKSCTYFVSCKEIAPSTGHEHIHIYAHFKTPYKLNKKILASGAHVEICKASPKQNIDYIKKDGNILDEWGEIPHQGVQYTVNDLREIDDPGELDWRMYNTWQKINSAPKKTKNKKWNKETEIYYIWGSSGIGKTDKAQELADEEFDEIKHNKHGFWIGVVDGKGCAVYDDFRDSHMEASEFINFVDYREHTMNTKGGFIRNQYTKIIITSIQDPEEIYKSSGEPKIQWLRRMKIIHMEDTNNDDCL